jgi:hypothetical protein
LCYLYSTHYWDYSFLQIPCLFFLRTGIYICCYSLFSIVGVIRSYYFTIKLKERRVGWCMAGDDIGLMNKDGALQFPVFHWKHPCLQKLDTSSWTQVHHRAAGEASPWSRGTTSTRASS